jgi:hypothetical protein
MQLKRTWSFHLPQSERLSSKSLTTTNAAKDVGERNLIHSWWECELVQPLWKAVWRFLKKLKLELPYDPVMPLLGIYPKECKPGYNRATCIPVFIVAPFTIAKMPYN